MGDVTGRNKRAFHGPARRRSFIHAAGHTSRQLLNEYASGPTAMAFLKDMSNDIILQVPRAYYHGLT